MRPVGDAADEDPGGRGIRGVFGMLLVLATTIGASAASYNAYQWHLASKRARSLTYIEARMAMLRDSDPGWPTIGGTELAPC